MLLNEYVENKRKCFNKSLKKISSFNINLIILFINIIILRFIKISTAREAVLNNEDDKNSYVNYINITIKGKGLQTIINQNYTNYLDLIQINGKEIITGNVANQQQLNLDTNVIKLAFNKQLNTSKDMFKN